MAHSPASPDAFALWKKDAEALHAELKASAQGLSSQEAKERLKRFGPNAIPDKDKRHWPQILIAQFASPLILILIAASFLAAFLGEMLDTVMILAIVIISALLGFYQEYKSERVLSELKKYVSYKAVVLRSGEKNQMDARELVPGDIVSVGLGDIIPADLRILETRGIAVDEAVLTGESKEVQKSALPAPPSAATPQEIPNGLFMGSVVVGGYARAMVVATGEKTVFGRTVSVFSSKVPESDFQLQTRKFGDMLIKVILVMTFFVFLVNFLLGHGQNPLIDSILFSLAIAVGIAPEALPAIITLCLSSGSLSLAKKKVVTKKLAAIEDLGNMDVLCTDKTGTLTEALRVERYIDLDEKDSHETLEYAVLCNEAVGTTRIRGNAIDVAIKKYAQKQKIDVSRFEKIHEIPFDFSRRRMGQVVREGKPGLGKSAGEKGSAAKGSEGGLYLIVKGAPESVFPICRKFKIKGKEYGSGEKVAELKRLVESYNLKGYTTIAVAYKDIALKEEYAPADEKDLIFIGFVLLFNPPKQSVRHTLERMKKLGVRLKLLTGDNDLVTRKLCEDVGLEIPEGRIVLGSELGKMPEKEFRKGVERYGVFARVTPNQKLRIVEALRANGHVVGFLGDGINDAPSLRAADVGISVDTSADVAKGASHLILLQHGLDVVCDGVEGGRKIFGNITKYILNTMSANQGNMITLALSSLFLPFIPLLPSQILLNNLLSDLPLVSISADNVDKEQTEKPQKWDMDYILKFMLFFGLISTVFDLLFICALYFFILPPDAPLRTETFRTAWFLESVLSEMIIVFSLRTRLPFFRSLPAPILVLSSIAAVLVSLGVIYFAPTADLFQFVPLPPHLLGFTALVLAGYVLATEIGKVFFFSKSPTGQPAPPPRSAASNA